MTLLKLKCFELALVAIACGIDNTAGAADNPIALPKEIRLGLVESPEETICNPKMLEDVVYIR